MKLTQDNSNRVEPRVWSEETTSMQNIAIDWGKEWVNIPLGYKKTITLGRGKELKNIHLATRRRCWRLFHLVEGKSWKIYHLATRRRCWRLFPLVEGKSWKISYLAAGRVCRWASGASKWTKHTQNYDSVMLVYNIYIALDTRLIRVMFTGFLCTYVATRVKITPKDIMECSYCFVFWMRQIAFHIALISLGNVWIQLFSLWL